jgi:hypothetical protein
VTARPVAAPVIPSGARLAGRDRGRAASLRRLPLAVAPEVPSAAGDVVYGFGRIDASGRVADRVTIAALFQPSSADGRSASRS